MLTYSELMNKVRYKFSKYTKEQCDFALHDIRETLELVKGDVDYTAKLLCERDCALERLAEIGRQENTKDRVLTRIAQNTLFVNLDSDGYIKLTMEALRDVMSKSYDAGAKSR